MFFERLHKLYIKCMRSMYTHAYNTRITGGYTLWIISIWHGAFDAIIGFIDDPGLGDEWLKGKYLLLAGGSRVSLDLLLPPIPFDESAGGVVQVGASTDCLSCLGSRVKP